MMGEFLDSGIVLTGFFALIAIVVGMGDLGLELAAVAVALVGGRVVWRWWVGRGRRG